VQTSISGNSLLKIPRYRVWAAVSSDSLLSRGLHALLLKGAEKGCDWHAGCHSGAGTPQFRAGSTHSCNLRLHPITAPLKIVVSASELRNQITMIRCSGVDTNGSIASSVVLELILVYFSYFILIPV
jgi:hypothetical protein